MIRGNVAEKDGGRGRETETESVRENKHGAWGQNTWICILVRTLELCGLGQIKIATEMLWSSHCGSVARIPISMHEDVGSIPDLDQ